MWRVQICQKEYDSCMVHDRLCSMFLMDYYWVRWILSPFVFESQVRDGASRRVIALLVKTESTFRLHTTEHCLLTLDIKHRIIQMPGKA